MKELGEIAINILIKPEDIALLSPGNRDFSDAENSKCSSLAEKELPA